MDFIKDHGTWTNYVPTDSNLYLNRFHVMFCKNETDTDWYQYISQNDPTKSPFSSRTSVKILITDENVVINANRDETAIYPAGLRLIEYNDGGEDTSTLFQYVGMTYDPATNDLKPKT